MKWYDCQIPLSSWWEWGDGGWVMGKTAWYQKRGYLLLSSRYPHHFSLNQQFITRRAKADHGSYFVAMYKRNRLTRGLKLKEKEEEKVK